MISSVRRFGAVALVGAGLLGFLAVPLHAQRLRPPVIPPLNNAGTGGVGRIPMAGLVPRLGTLNNGVSPIQWMNPYMNNRQFAYNTAVLGRALRNVAPVAPYALGYNPLLSARLITSGAGLYGGGYGLYGGVGNLYGGYGLNGGGYGGYGGYGNPYGPYGGYGLYSPFSLGLMSPYGYLQGSASVINANGQYYVMTQEARIKREKARQEMIETRRKLFDELMYERKMTPTAEELRQRDLKTALDKARHQPPAGDVLSGRSLNDLFQNLVREPSLLNNGPSVPISEDTLNGVNFSNGNGGNVGLLKSGGKLSWPQPLEGSQFKEPRERLSKLFAEAVQGVGYNGTRANPGTIRDMTNDLDALQKTLGSSVSELSPTQWVEAQRYLRELKGAIRALQNERVQELIKPSGLAKVRNVAGLVKWMSDNGLTFAPATNGDESSYRALYNALVNFDSAAVAAAQK
jgi:hypothetical protein